MDRNENNPNQPASEDTVNFQDPDPISQSSDPAADAIELLLPKADAGQTIEIKLRVNLAELKQWHTERWSELRPHSVADKVYIDEPNPWFSRYPEEDRNIIVSHGKNEANNPINRIYNEELVAISYARDIYPWEEHQKEEDREAVWIEMLNSLSVNWIRYIDSGCADELSFDEFREAYYHMKMIFKRELIESEGMKNADLSAPRPEISRD